MADTGRAARGADRAFVAHFHRWPAAPAPRRAAPPPASASAPRRPPGAAAPEWSGFEGVASLPSITRPGAKKLTFRRLDEGRRSYNPARPVARGVHRRSGAADGGGAGRAAPPRRQLPAARARRPYAAADGGRQRGLPAPDAAARRPLGEPRAFFRHRGEDD